MESAATPWEQPTEPTVSGAAIVVGTGGGSTLGAPPPPSHRATVRSARTALALRAVAPLAAIPAKRCPGGHPNDPDAIECRLCSAHLGAMAPVVDLPTETLGRLLLEDGTAVDLDADLVIGRCPADDGVDTLTVPGPQVSRRHLGIEVRGWRLLIRDRGSTNGTFLTRRGERGRRRVPEDHAIALHVGDAIHFGTRQALVVPAHPG